jgi:hypothetical protein
MAETLLSATNEVLKRVGLIQGDAAELTTLTDSPRQMDIDKIGQIWREVCRLLQSMGVFPSEVTEGSLTLATDTREYAIPSDFVQMSGESYETRVMVNASNRFRMFEYRSPPGISPDSQMFLDQPDPSNWVGIPYHWVLSDRGNFFRVERFPTSTENGLVYKFRYDTALTLITAGATFPFSDSVVGMLIPVVAHFVKVSSEARTSEAIIALPAWVAAVRFATRNKARSSYGPYAFS